MTSLDLAPALLSIYDTIAARTNGEVKCTLSNHDKKGSNKNDKIQTENQNNFRQGTLENDYGHRIFAISFAIFESEL